MTKNTFELNEQTLSVIEEIGGHMPGGFFIYQAEVPEKLLYVNKAVFDIFGCTDLEDFKALTGYTFKGMVHPDDYQKISDSIAQQIDTDKNRMDYAVYRIIRKDGAVRWVDDYGHYTETEMYGGIYVVFISDITEKVLSQEKHQKGLNSMVTAMASDYRSVYHVDIDADDAVCYRADPNDPNQTPEGIHFPYRKWIEEYGDLYVDEEYKGLQKLF
jgi:PAS domain S-box-containing protein